MSLEKSIDYQLDEFLATANQDAHPKFAELDIRQALDVLVVIPAEDHSGKYSLTSEVLAALRAEVQAWIKIIRDQGQMVTGMLSASVREQNARLMIQRLLETAYNAPARAWMTTLPTGKQLVIAPSSVVAAAGFDGVCRVAHESAIRSARHAGRPYNAQAFSHYQSLSPSESPL